MFLDDPDLKFIHFVDNLDQVKAKNTLALERILGDSWKARTDRKMLAYAQELIVYGNTHLSSCRDIIALILQTRKYVENPFSEDGSWPPVNFFVHDANSGFDSEAGLDGGGSIYVNLCARAGFKDKHGKLWYVPMLLVIFHELGHYLQYLSNPKYYNKVAEHPDENRHHLLDAMNLPDNEYPICRDLGMGIREQYLDMQDLNSPQFRGVTVNYTKHLSRKHARDEHGFIPATEPEEVREKREKLERLRLEQKGVQTVSTKLPCLKCSKQFSKLILERHMANCTG
jgi:hypothetical protein